MARHRTPEERCLHVDASARSGQTQTVHVHHLDICPEIRAR
jgi:hypothetical protein